LALTTDNCPHEIILFISYACQNTRAFWYVFVSRLQAPTKKRLNFLAWYMHVYAAASAGLAPAGFFGIPKSVGFLA